MEETRRKFLKLAGLSVIGACSAGSALEVIAAGHGAQNSKPVPEYKKENKALTAKQWAMVIDTRQFESAQDLEPLIEACHSVHNVPDFMDKDHPEYSKASKRHEIKWLWEDEFQHVFTDQAQPFMSDRMKYVPMLALCNHCENPPCVQACPTKATFKRDDGIVLMDFHRCIGCRFCMAACPYGSRSFNFRDPRPFIKKRNPEFPTRMRGVVEKCNFCAERLAVGKMPACVEASNGAIAFGDLYDPESDVRKLISENHTIRRKPSLGTGPCVYYIL